MDNQDKLYDTYKDLVINLARRFQHLLPGEELDDLTQTCWEAIIRKYNTFDSDKSSLSTWIVIVSKSALYDLIRSSNTDKRVISKHTRSLDALVNNRERFL